MPESFWKRSDWGIKSMFPHPTLTDPTTYFDPAMINRFFNIAGGNLGSRMATDRGRAQSAASSLAASRGFLNPSAFILGQGSQAAAPYIPQMAGLEANRAGALQENQQGLFRAKQGQEQFLLDYLMRQRQLAQQQQQYEDQNSAGFLDWASALLPLLTAPMSGGTSLLGYLPKLFGGTQGGGGGGRKFDMNSGTYTAY